MEHGPWQPWLVPAWARTTEGGLDLGRKWEGPIKSAEHRWGREQGQTLLLKGRSMQVKVWRAQGAKVQTLRRVYAQQTGFLSTVFAGGADLV